MTALPILEVFNIFLLLKSSQKNACDDWARAAERLSTLQDCMHPQGVLVRALTIPLFIITA